MSFQDWPLLGERSWIGFENYRTAFQDIEFINSVKFTLLYTVIVTPLLFFTALGMALLIKGTSRTISLVLILSVAGSLLAFDQFYIITGGNPNGSTLTTVFNIYRQSFLQFQLGYL